MVRWIVRINMTGWAVASLYFRTENGIHYLVDSCHSESGIEKLEQVAKEANKGNIVYNPANQLVSK